MNSEVTALAALRFEGLGLEGLELEGLGPKATGWRPTAMGVEGELGSQTRPRSVLGDRAKYRHRMHIDVWSLSPTFYLECGSM